MGSLRFGRGLVDEGGLGGFDLVAAGVDGGGADGDGCDHRGGGGENRDDGENKDGNGENRAIKPSSTTPDQESKTQDANPSTLSSRIARGKTLRKRSAASAFDTGFVSPAQDTGQPRRETKQPRAEGSGRDDIQHVSGSYKRALLNLPGDVLSRGDLNPAGRRIQTDESANKGVNSSTFIPDSRHPAEDYVEEGGDRGLQRELFQRELFQRELFQRELLQRELFHQQQRRQQQRHIRAPFNEFAPQQMHVWEGRRSLPLPPRVSAFKTPMARQTSPLFGEEAAGRTAQQAHVRTPPFVPQARNLVLGRAGPSDGSLTLQTRVQEAWLSVPATTRASAYGKAMIGRARGLFDEPGKRQAHVRLGPGPGPSFASGGGHPLMGSSQRTDSSSTDTSSSNTPSSNTSSSHTSSSNTGTQSSFLIDGGTVYASPISSSAADFSPSAELHTTTPSPKTIRLLKAVAREGKHTMDTDEIPDYTMEEFPYPECPDYTGLSYVWGEENPGVSIRVNGKSVAIRSNLGQALARIATSDPGAYVWADAICINQQDDEEKSRLVQHMGQIFANAKLVYAWLGPVEKATPGSSSTEDLFTHLSRLGGLFWEHAGLEDIKRGIGKLNERRLDLELILEKNLDVLFDLFRRGDFPVEEYSAFSARPFWSRVWVLQEVYLAKNLYYLCGHCRLASRTLAGALILLETFQRRLIRSRGSLREQVTTNAPLAKFAFRLPSFPEMHRLVIYTSIYPLDVVSLRIAMTNFCVKELPSGSRATDPRDMIYGLLGFANEEERAYIRADYGKDVRESYVVATRRMIQNGFTDVLAWAQPERKRVAGLPSWVPDYSSTIYESLCSQGQAKAWLPRFRACGESDYSDQAARLDGPLVLPVHGRRLGVLLGVGAQDWFPRSHTRAAYPSSSSSSSSSSSAGAGEALLARAVPHERLLAFLTEIQDLGRRAQAITGRDDGATDLTWRVPCCDQIVMDSRLVRRDPSTKSRYEQTLEGLRACLREPGRELPSQSRPYVEALLRWVDKRPFLTASGLVGLGPARARAGDEVVALEGFSACYVLRRQDGLERNEFTLVGEAYVDGAMDGEMMGCSDSDSDSSEWFYLV